MAGLRELQAAREAVAVDVPVELLQYVDGGGNPDAFTADVFRRANRGNQLAKGRVQALAGFRCALRDGCRRPVVANAKRWLRSADFRAWGCTYRAVFLRQSKSMAL